MPLLGKLLAGILTSIFGIFGALVGAQYAVRLAGVASVAALYVASVALFSATIGPWIGSLFNTQYGQLLGLLFPPAAGTVLAALALYWASVMAFKYLSSLTKMAAG